MIPLALRKRLADDPFMSKCVYCGATPVEWDHALKYAGRQINEWYAIVPLCTFHHRGNNGTIFKDVRNFTELLAITRGLVELQKTYYKTDWAQRKKYLTRLCQENTITK